MVVSDSGEIAVFCTGLSSVLTNPPIRRPAFHAGDAESRWGVCMYPTVPDDPWPALGGDRALIEHPAEVQPDLPPTAEEIKRISAVVDPVIRNLQITECYSRLAAAMARRTYPCANWCSFATWASKQAGATIRGEDMLDDLGRELGRSAEVMHPIDSFWRLLLRWGLLQRETAFGRWVASLHTPFDAVQLASDAVAEGNLKVFAEIGLAFADYLGQCPPEAPPDSAEVAAFIDRLRPGPPPGGQDYLKSAFVAYQAQGTVENRGQRAQLIVLANLQIGLHEQTRLQPQILAAMNSGVTGVEEGFGLRIRDRVLQRQLTKLSRAVITRAMMVLTLPGATLSLIESIARPFPDDLTVIDNPNLRALVGEYGVLPPALEVCGAQDWSILSQRMRYISHLFRAYHEYDKLADAPFTAVQVSALERGVIPDGAL